jgi:hypothetical protein
LTLFARVLLGLLVLVALTFAAAGYAEPRLQWLNRVPVAHDPNEAPEDMRARLYAADQAIIRAANGNQELAAALAVLGSLESAYARYVAEGRCHQGRWKCDVDPRTGKPRARGYWQAWAVSCPELHAGDGPPDVDIAAKCAANLLRFGKARCKTWAGAFNTYGGRSQCDHPKGKKRAERVRRLLGGGGAS